MIRRSLFALLLIACGPAWAASNCIPSGVTDQYTYFVAVDSTDKTTRETGLSTFTVYRSRNGGTATAFTTPTINETDSSNMPGVYELLLDEDMTIDSGDDVQHMVLHITHAGMEPVTKEICIARAKVTAGETLTVSSGAVSTVSTVSGDVGGIAAGGLTVDAFNSDTNPLFGIARQGTAQSATSTTLVLDSGASFADDAVNGMTLIACGSTQGYCQSRAITDYTGSSDTATVSTWSVTPSGTITYYLFGTAPSSGGSGATAEEVWTYSGGRSLTVFDEDDMTIDINSTAVGAVASVTGNIGGNVTGSVGSVTGNVGGTINGLTSTAQGHVRTAVGLASANLDTQLGTIDSNVDAVLVDTGTTLDGKLDTIDGLVDAIKAVTDNLPDSGALTSLASASALSTVDGNVDDIKTIAEKLDTMLEADDSDFKFTAEALAETPVGEGGGLDASGIRNAIGLASANLDTQLGAIGAVTAKLDDTLEDQGGGTYGFTEAALQEAPTSGGSGGDDAETIAQAVATELGDGSGFTAITGAISGLNDLSSSDVQSAAGAALASYDPPTRAELTSDINSVLSAIGDLNDIDAADLRDLIIEDQGGGVSLGCALSVILAYAAGDLATTANSPTYKDPSGSETRISGSISSAGNRAMTITCPSY